MPLKAINLQDTLRDAIERFSGFRRDMVRNEAYAKGIQYSIEDLNYMNYHKRPNIAWNVIMPKLLAVAAFESSNKLTARAEPVEKGDVEMADIFNRVLEYDNQKINLPYIISRAALHAAIYRYGVLYCGWEVSGENPDGQWMVKNVSPLDVWWDDNPSSLNFDDSSYIIYSRWADVDWIKKTYASNDKVLQSLLETKAEGVEGVDNRNRRRRSFASQGRLSSFGNMLSDKEQTTFTRNGVGFNRSTHSYNAGAINDFVNAATGMYRIIELHHNELEDALFVRDFKRNESAAHRIPDDKIHDREYVGSILKMFNVDERALIQISVDVKYMSVAVPELWDEVFFDKPYSVQGYGYCLKILPCYGIGASRHDLISVVDTLIDPQDVINHDLSSVAHLKQKILNPDIWLGNRAIDATTDMAALGSSASGKVITFHDLNQVKEVLPNIGGINVFNAQANMAIAMSDAIVSRSLTGGSEGSGESGKLVQVRVSQSEGMLSMYIDNITQTLISVEKFHVGAIQRHLQLPRWVRVIREGSGDEEGVWINEYDPNINRAKNDVTIGKYDIYIDRTKYTKTEQQMQLDKIIQVMQMSNEQMRQAMMPFVVDLMKIPQSKQLNTFATAQLHGLIQALELQKEEMNLKMLQIQMEKLNLEPQLMKMLQSSGQVTGQQQITENDIKNLQP